MKFSTKYLWQCFLCQGIEQLRSLWDYFFCSCWVPGYPSEEGISIRQEDLPYAGSCKASWPSGLTANLIAQALLSPSFSVSLNRVMKRFFYCYPAPSTQGSWNHPELSESRVLWHRDGMMSVPLTGLLDSHKALGRTYPSKPEPLGRDTVGFSSWHFRDEKGQ